MGFKQSVFILLIALMCVFLQATLFGTFFPRWLVPNLCLSIIIYLGIYESNALGALLAFLVGIFLDMASAPLIGPWGGSFVVLFGVLSQGGKKLFVDSTLTLSVLSFAGSIATQIVYFFLLSQFSFNWDQLISWTLLGSAVSTAVFAPIIFSLLAKFYPRRYSHGRFIQQRLF